MAFQPPNLPVAKTRTEAFVGGLGQGAQNAISLASLWRQHKLQKMQEELAIREAQSKYGTGVPAPLGPVPESKEEQLARVGTEAFGRLNPVQYVAPGVDPVTGQATFTPYPTGTRPGPASPSPTPILTPEGEQVGTTVGKPQVLPQPKSGITGKKEVKQALDLYETARDGLLSGLKGTRTGFFSGRLPAMTSEQQTAEGAVSAMAPVLKQLFRVSGEGVFTDKDQELLLNMVPTRKDTPDARKAKIENIDNIVKAKLGMGKPDGISGPQAGDIEDGYRFKGGNPADPANWERE